MDVHDESPERTEDPAPPPRRRTPQPVQTDPEALSELTQLTSFIATQAQRQALDARQEAAKVIEQARAEARDIVERARAHAGELVREGREFLDRQRKDAEPYLQELLASARDRIAQQEALTDVSCAEKKKTADELLAVARREAGRLLEATERECAHKRAVEAEAYAHAQSRRAELERTIAELQEQQRNLALRALEAKALVNDEARKEAELRRVELQKLLDLQDTVTKSAKQQLDTVREVATTTGELAQKLVRPAEPRTSGTEVIGAVLQQFMRSGEEVLKRALERPERGDARALPGTVAGSAAPAPAAAPAPTPAQPDPRPQPSVATSTSAVASASAADEIAARAESDWMEAVQLRPTDLPQELLESVSMELYNSRDISRLTLRDLQAAALIHREKGRQVGGA